MLIANVSDWSTRVQYLPYCTTVHFDSKTKQNNKSKNIQFACRTK